jgi:hypothetical protein
MSVTEKTKILLAYTTYRYNPEAYYLVVTSEINNQIISLQVLDLKSFYRELVIDLVFFTEKIVSYYNKYCNIKPTFKERNKIYLI